MRPQPNSGTLGRTNPMPIQDRLLVLAAVTRLSLLGVSGTPVIACVSPQRPHAPASSSAPSDGKFAVSTNGPAAPVTYVGAVRARCGPADTVCITFANALGNDFQLRQLLVTLDDSGMFVGKPPETPA